MTDLLLALGYIGLAIVVGMLLIMIGFLLFMRRWASQEEARQRQQDAERITHRRQQAAGRVRNGR